MDKMAAKLFAIRYGHWVILTISSFMLLVFALTPDYVKERKLIKRVNNLVKELHSRDVNIPKEQVITDYSTIAKSNWVTSLRVDPAPDHKHIYPPFRIKFIRELPHEKHIDITTKLRLVKEHKKLVITWKFPTVRGDKTTQVAKSYDYLLVKSWQENGKQQQKHFFLTMHRTRFVDKEIDIDVRYSYKLRAYTKNLQAKDGEKISIKNQSVLAGPFSNTVTGSIPSIYKMHLLGVAGDTAMLSIQKMIDGQWRKTTCPIKKGEEIKTYVKVGKNFEDVKPGWTLVDMNPRVKRFRTLVFREPMVDPKTGNLIFRHGKLVYEKVKRRQEYYTCAIRYKGAKSNIITLYQHPPKK